MSNDLISVLRTDLLMAMDELRLAGRDYPADLLKKALLSAPVGAEPVGLSLEVRTLGSYGKAFDLPGNRRAYTYDHQPGNVEASRLGNACQQAAAASAGDTIDRGLGLLKELQAQGFGVFDAESSRWHAAPVAAQPALEGWKLVPVEPTGGMLQALSGEWHSSRQQEARARYADMLNAAPVAAQPDVTQQTLDDVKAGIPARDAEIEAMRKQIETLQAQLQSPVNVHSNMCRGIIAPITFDMLAHVLGDDAKQEWIAAQAQPSSDRAMLLELMEAFDMEVWNCPNCTATEETKDCDSAIMLREYLANNPVPAQQPVSGADGLLASPTQGMTLGQRIAHVGGRENAQGYVEFGSPMAVNALIQHVLRDLHQAGTSDAPQAQQDHLPDATKMVAADQFRDAAQMIEPSGNSGELPEDDSIALDRLADYIADTWPMDKKYSLEEICQRLHVMWPGEFIAIEDLRKNDPNLREAVRALLIHWQRFQKSDGNQQDAYNLLVKGAKMAWKFAEDELSRSESPDAQVQTLAQQDADKVDAERYRVIKFGPTLFKRSYSGDGTYRAIEYLPLTGEQLDSFTDAARKETI